MDKQEDTNSAARHDTVFEEGKRAGIYGSIRDREISHVDSERWWGVARGPEKITFKDGGAVMFKCDIRHYWMAENPDTAIREAVAYQIDRVVGLGLVPKTMVIDDTINGVRYDGSAQEWVQDATDGYQIDKFTPEQKIHFERLRIFDFVIGNSDRHLENVLFTKDGKLHAIDNNACLIIDKEEDILSFPDTVINFFSKNVVQDMPHVVELIEKFYCTKDKILDLIEKYVHDNTGLAKLMVESRINYLYKMIKDDRPFPRKYLQWRRELDDEVQSILKRRNSPE